MKLSVFLIFSFLITTQIFAADTTVPANVSVSEIRSKLICGYSRDSKGIAQQDYINSEIAKLNGRIISVSAPSSTLDWASGGAVCVTVMYKVAVQVLRQEQ